MLNYHLVLEVISQRKTVLIDELATSLRDKRKKDVSDLLFARINECDINLKLLKDRIDAETESTYKKPIFIVTVKDGDSIERPSDTLSKHIDAHPLDEAKEVKNRPDLADPIPIENGSEVSGSGNHKLHSTLT